MKQLNALWAKLEKAGQAPKKADPFYGKSRRLAEKIGASIEIERMGAYGSNYWITLPDSVKSHAKKFDHFSDNMVWAGDWYAVFEILERIDEFMDANKISR